jgi:hypothetical protein
MSSNLKPFRFAIGDHVAISHAGQLIGLVVDFLDDTDENVVVAFPSGKEFIFHHSWLIRK